MKYLKTNGQNERNNDPDRPTSITDVVNDIRNEERYIDNRLKEIRRNGVRKFAESVCSDSPTGAHHFVYPPQGTRGAARCKYCPSKAR